MASASGRTTFAKLLQLGGLMVLLAGLFAALLLPYVGGVGLIAKAGADKFLNTDCTLVEEPVQQKTTLLASDGKTVIATLFDQNRQVVPLSQIPTSVINALISTEDRRFYDHHGVDVRGLIRAALHTSNGNTQGASTLTEQYVKQVRYYQASTPAEQAAAIDQNLDRKLQDAQCALKIEREYTKQQILEKYLNIAFFGENSYGIETAAQTYFGVDVSKLTVPQAALLVGLVKAPSDYDPYDHLQDARARRDLVLTNLADQNYISAADKTTYLATPITLAKASLPARGCANANAAILNAGFFCDYASDWLQSVGGFTAQKVNTAGFTIVTTLDANLQNQGQNAIWTQSGLNPTASHGYLLAMPSVDPRSGAVTSMITDKHYGIDETDPSKTSAKIFTDAYAGSGSTYKYFTALAALTAGVPSTFSLTTPKNAWTPKNCPQVGYTAHNAGNYKDTLPLNLALPESSNTYFVAMEDQLFGCDLSPIVNMATSLGMNYLKNTKAVDSNGKATGNTVAQQIIAERRPTFTLGQESTPVLELTSAFATVANDGVYCPPTPITSITDPNGKPVTFNRPGCTRAFSSYVARTMLNIMVNDTHSGYGTAGGFFSRWYGNGGSLVAGKTGTNNACSPNPATGACDDNGKNSALWFVGITPTLTSAAALVNPQSPTLTIANVPGITEFNDGSDTFGATAARFWLQAYGPTLQPLDWDWPTINSTPGTQIPNVTGQDTATATNQLTQSGFKVNVMTTRCGSALPAGRVAFAGPTIALAGSTINVCISSGTAPFTAPTSTAPSSSPPVSSSVPPSSSSSASTSGNTSKPKPS